MSQTLLNIPINYIFKNNKETRVVVVRRPDNLLLSLENVQIHKHDDDEDAIDLKKLGIDIKFGELDPKKAKEKNCGILTIYGTSKDFEDVPISIELGYEKSRLEQLINLIEAKKENYLNLYTSIIINRKEMKKKRDTSGLNYWLIERFSISNIINN